MKHRPIMSFILILVAFLAPTRILSGQARSGSGNSGFRTGLSVGYLTRALGVNDKEQDAVPKMMSLLASLVLEYELQPGFTLAAQVGYSSSKFDHLAFRGLPFSLEMGADSGSMGGILVGVEIGKSLLGGDAFGVEIRGQFLASLGLSREWELPGLAVEGSAKGRPTWMKASVGPVLTYQGWESVTPFVYPCFDYLWGSVEFDETAQELTGSEDKDIKSKSQFGLGLGADFELSPSLRFRGEGGVYPRSGGTDFSFVIQTLFAF